MNQGHDIFSPETRGKQCTAMAAVGIAMSVMQHPKTWTSSTVDDVLLYGDALFSSSIKNRRNVSLDEINSHYLTAEEINEELIINERKCKFIIKNIIYGHLHNDYSQINMPNLKNFLKAFMDKKGNGILTCNGISVALISANNVVGIFDSHSRGPFGKSEENGVACFIAAANADELFNILSTNIPSCTTNNLVDGQYQFTDMSAEVENINVNNVSINNDNIIEECVVRTEEEINSVHMSVAGFFSRTKTCEELIADITINEPEKMQISWEEEKEDSDQFVENEPFSAEVENLPLQQEQQSKELHCDRNIQDSDESIEMSELFCSNECLNEGLQDRPVDDQNAIINMEWIWSQLHKAYDNHGGLFSCNFVNIKLIEKISSGLKKYFIFKCDMCGLESKICSVPEGDKDLDLNTAAVLGCQNIGIGLYQFEELCGICGMKCMSYKTWQKSHTEACAFVKKAAEEEMSNAAAEERRLAIERNDVIDGIPCTMVEGDGSYMKRSYVHGKYDSPGCCVVIIGRYTQKIIDVVVKQKSCAICDFALSRGVTPKKHECYRNHGRDQSSTSMESAAVTEAFNNNIKKNNLIYKTFISDGDSSNYKAIVDSNPYGKYGIEVKNILCSNHIKRNVSTSLKQISKKKGNLGSLRKKIENSAPRFIETISECVQTVSQQNVSWEVKCRELRKDLKKLPFHIFGDHSHCLTNNYGCNGQAKEKEENLVSILEKANLFKDIDECLFRAIRNAESLLQNVTTNKSENFNALIAKTIGGKRVHFAKKDSYASRCNVAVLANNVNETIVPICTAAEKNVPSTAERVQRTRATLNQFRSIRNKNKDSLEEKVQKINQVADADYGPYAYQVDVNETELSVLIEEHYKVLNDWVLEREAIELRTREQSDCGEWKNKRRWLITASKIGRICKKRPHTSCKGIVSDILYPRPKNDEPAVDYGIAMEFVAKEILKQHGYDVQPNGLFLHPEVVGIAGTPDGLLNEDGIIEIKCPYTGKYLHPEEAIKNKKLYIGKAFYFQNNTAYLKENHDYYYQVQCQLSVTGRQYCLFVVFTLVDIKIIRIERNEAFIQEMLLTAAVFYKDCLVPEIVDSRRKRRLPIRDPEYIKEAQNKAKRNKNEKREKQTL